MLLYAFTLVLFTAFQSSSALKCKQCHTPKSLKLQGRTFTNTMANLLHTGIQHMEASIMEDPKHNFPDVKMYPVCRDSMPDVECEEGEVCGYAEMHDRYFARTCVSLNETIYQNSTLNQCYIHGMLMHKTTFLYCDTDLCNEKHILPSDRDSCPTHTWKMIMAGMNMGGMSGSAPGILPTLGLLVVFPVAIGFLHRRDPMI